MLSDFINFNAERQKTERKNMKNTSKILALVLVVMTVIMSLSAISASAAVETKTYVFEASELGASAAGTWIDGQEVPAGTDDFFTLIMSAKTVVDSSNKKFEDDYSASLRWNLKGKSTKEINLIKFTTEGPATFKIWWVSGGSGRNFEIWDSSKEKTVATIENSLASNTLAISEVNITSAGTYYFASPVNSNYIFKVEISVQVETCSHTGGTATCKDLAVCELCNTPYGELSTVHNYVDGECTVCGEADPSACQHTNKTPATCLLSETCNDCGEEFTPALGHTAVKLAAVAPTCTTKGLTAGSKCSVCDVAITAQEEVAALGHTLTFNTTFPTSELKGKTTASCSECDFTFESAEVGVMTPGSYTLDAADMAGIASGDLFDGEVKVYGGVFAAHLSNKYRTDAGRTKDNYIDYEATHRMNFGGQSELLDNGEGDDAVPNGGFKNFIQITTTGDVTTVTIYWGCGGDGRQVGIYDKDGKIVVSSNETSVKNDVYRTELEVPAGTWFIGGYIPEGVGSGTCYINRIVVDVHEHEWKDATCESPKSCECGAEEGDALGHTYNFCGGICGVCYALNPDFKANLIVEGENTVTVDQYHLVDFTGHGHPYQFTYMTITKPGKYYLTSDKPITFYVFADEVNSESADFTAGTGASWNTFTIVGELAGQIISVDLEPGTYYIGMIYMGGGLSNTDYTQDYGEYKVNLIHIHEWSEPTCTEPAKCVCGETGDEATGHSWKDATCTAPKTCEHCDETEGEALGHTYADGACTVCEEADPNYVEPTLWEKIINMIMGFIQKILAFFKRG